jgi:hypothetical protein
MKNKTSRYLSNMQISEFEPILDGLQIKIGKTIYGSTVSSAVRVAYHGIYIAYNHNNF